MYPKVASPDHTSGTSAQTDLISVHPCQQRPQIHCPGPMNRRRRHELRCSSLICSGDSHASVQYAASPSAAGAKSAMMSTSLKPSTCWKSESKPLSLMVRPATLTSAAHSACECCAAPTSRRSNHALSVMNVHVVEARAPAREQPMMVRGERRVRSGHSCAYRGSRTSGAQEHLQHGALSSGLRAQKPQALGVRGDPRVDE